MKKRDVLDLIDASYREIKYALDRDDITLTEGERKLLSDNLVRIETYSHRFLTEIPEDDEKLIEGYHKSFQIALGDLVEFRRRKELEAGINCGEKIIDRDTEESKSEETKDEEKTVETKPEESKPEETKDEEKLDKLVVIPARVYNNTTKEEITKPDPFRIIEVISEEKQSEQTKKERDRLIKVLRGVFYVLGSAAAIALVAAAIKYCVDHPNGKEIPVTPTTTPTSSNSTIGRLKPGWGKDDIPSVTPAPEIVSLINNININDYDELMEYATQLQSQLKGEESSKLPIYDIIKAVKMANWDSLEDKSVFDNRESVVRGTYNEGLIAAELGSNAIVQKDVNSDIFITNHQMTDILMCVTDNKLSLDCFESAKVDDRGYDIYAVIDTCIAGMNKHIDSEVEEEIEQDRLYAMVFNDVVSRAVRNFTIVNSDEALVSTVYYVLGTFNATLPRNIELTAGRSYGTAYGNGHENDGGYGDICIEVLSSALYIVHEGTNQYTGNDQACIFYGDFIDKAIIEPYQGQSLGLN